MSAYLVQHIGRTFREWSLDLPECACRLSNFNESETGFCSSAIPAYTKELQYIFNQARGSLTEQCGYPSRWESYVFMVTLP
jgi:hypothetical protein